jgi:stearoyl-CoA desaturase (delta-9 desaturase)
MKKIDSSAVFWLTFVHLGAVLALPFFSWSALAVCLLLLFTISPIGVNLTYHRMLTHRALRVPKPLEYALATFGVLSAQGSPLLWVAGHRLHHRYSDTARDPHNSREGFFHVHMGHLLYSKVGTEQAEDKLLLLVPDLTSQPFYRFLHRQHLPIALAALPLLYLAGGWSWVLWGGFVRVTLMLHITWCVNSVTHNFGYRNFDTPDESRNNWWVAILAAGEGWHNNHHAEPSCAAHGRTWWEFDLTYLLIRGLRAAGLATHVIAGRRAPRQAKPLAAERPRVTRPAFSAARPYFASPETLLADHRSPFADAAFRPRAAIPAEVL